MQPRQMRRTVPQQIAKGSLQGTVLKQMLWLHRFSLALPPVNMYFHMARRWRSVLWQNVRWERFLRAKFKRSARWCTLLDYRSNFQNSIPFMSGKRRYNRIRKTKMGGRDMFF